MEQTLTMSNQEIDRLKVVSNVINGKLTWNEAGVQLDLSGRQVGRLCGKVLKNGNAGIIHGLRGKLSNNQLEPGLLEKAMKHVKSKYSDFGPTFANEKLFKRHLNSCFISAMRGTNEKRKKQMIEEIIKINKLK